jgi:hypothetical protein
MWGKSPNVKLEKLIDKSKVKSTKGQYNNTTSKREKSQSNCTTNSDNEQ